MKPSEMAECGPGWSGILKALDVVLDGEVVHQVKEKFGGLRVDYALNESTPAWMKTCVDILEKTSLTICEDCGCYGSMRNKDGWLRVQCDGCADA